MSLNRIILCITGTIFIVVLVWANVTKLDEVTRGAGRVIPSSQAQIIQNLEGGTVTEILVDVGDSVAKDQTIIVIDNTRFLSSYREYELQIEALQARISRLRAELGNNDFNPELNTDGEGLEPIRNEVNIHLANKRDLRSSLDILGQKKKQQEEELEQIRSEQSKLATSFALARKDLVTAQTLLAEGTMSEAELKRLHLEVNEFKAQLVDNRLRISRIRTTIRDAQIRMEERQEQFISKAQAELKTAEIDIARLKENRLALEKKDNTTHIVSPVKGTVIKIDINAPGELIQAGRQLMEIMPIGNDLLIEADIRGADITFLRPGQNATVTITDYDFADYGGLRAKLDRVGADVIRDKYGEPYHQVRLIVDKVNLGSAEDLLSIPPGTTTEVDIFTGKISLINYFLKPIMQPWKKPSNEISRIKRKTPVNL